MEDRGGNAGASEEDVNHTICHTTQSMNSNERDGQLQHGGAENLQEDEDYQVIFERKLSFGNRESGPDMDETIWQSLPEDVEDKVLAWLPVTSCARFKSVCKRWHNLMNPERFFQMHSSNAPPETWILSFGDQSPEPNLGFKYKGQVSDPVTSKTFMLEFPFLSRKSVPVATAGGLVCFCCDSSSSEENDLSFYVCNPITKAWKFIPSPCPRVSIVTFVADSDHPGFMGYKLYLFCEASVVRWLWVGVLDHSTKEYDSKLNRWKDVGDVHSSEQFKSGSVTKRFTYCRPKSLKLWMCNKANGCTCLRLLCNAPATTRPGSGGGRHGAPQRVPSSERAQLCGHCDLGVRSGDQRLE